MKEVKNLGKKFIKKVSTAEDVKEKYAKLMAKYQRDFETLREINNEFDELMGELKNIHENHITNELYVFDYQDDVEHFKKIINKYQGLEGVDVEVNGCFIYITGRNTINIKEDLKYDNFKWQRGKDGKQGRWYYSSRPYRTRAFYEVQEAKLA